MTDETVTEDNCDNCGEAIYYGDDGIACYWVDLAFEHECDSEWTDD